LPRFSAEQLLADDVAGRRRRKQEFARPINAPRPANEGAFFKARISSHSFRRGRPANAHLGIGSAFERRGAETRIFIQKPQSGTLQQLAYVGPSPVAGELLQLRFLLGSEMNFHATKTGKAAKGASSR
jgi:hypothetical protein